MHVFLRLQGVLGINPERPQDFSSGFAAAFLTAFER